MNKLLSAIKEASLQSTDESKPMGFFFGEVVSIHPLIVNVENKFPLTEEFLTLTHAVKDYCIDITIQGEDQEEEEELKPKSTHKGKKKIMLHCGLKVGEQVMLLRVQGGQNYIIINRVNDPICEGEWLGATFNR